MWKYVSRRFRETFERSANHIERTTNVVNSTNTINEENRRPCKAPCRWFTPRRCWDSFRSDKKDTNGNRWNCDHLNRSWIGAITWSGAIVFGWYSSQILNLMIKKHKLNHSTNNVSIKNIIAVLQPYGICNNTGTVNNDNSVLKLENIFEKFNPTIQLVSNEQHNGENSASSSFNLSTNSNSSDDLGEVLNSIENKLGLAAIESGQHEVGLNLLRSAANRNHAPALFNLGLCYERGTGITADEKMALELYKAAAALQHPGALFNLGVYYGQGRGGVQRDEQTATRLLRLAALQGQQEAIDALKSLDIEIQLPKIEVDPWLLRQNPLLNNDNIVPTHSTLFVENINFSPSLNSEMAY